MCLRVLSERSQLLLEVFGEQSRSVLAKMLQSREQENKRSHKTVSGATCLGWLGVMYLD